MRNNEADILAEFRNSVLTGFSNRPIKIPPRYFYDETGSKLFHEICQQPEYYLTDAELQILEKHIDEIVASLNQPLNFIEYGSGASLKTRIFLDKLGDAVTYVPVDISSDFLQITVDQLSADYPNLRIVPITADYTAGFALPQAIRDIQAYPVVYFSGSTIGNLDGQLACKVLGDIRQHINPHGQLLVAADLVKDEAVLKAAYNDKHGVTEKFNKNLLARINRELNANFNLDNFDHRAFYNRKAQRIEMYLVSRINQTVKIESESFSLEAGEAIHTENSYKYTLEGFAKLLGRQGMARQKYWLDDNEFFSLQLFHCL